MESLLRLIKDLGSHLKPVKSLQIQIVHKLKRLASALRFRPWPPFFNSLQTGIRVRHAKPSSLSWAGESEKYSQNSGKRTFMSFERRFFFGCAQKDLEDNQPLGENKKDVGEKTPSRWQLQLVAICGMTEATTCEYLALRMRLWRAFSQTGVASLRAPLSPGTKSSGEEQLAAFSFDDAIGKTETADGSTPRTARWSAPVLRTRGGMKRSNYLTKRGHDGSPFAEQNALKRQKSWPRTANRPGEGSVRRLFPSFLY